MSIRCAYVPQLLMPKEGTDLSKWAVVACDQYTSQPEYWEQVEKIVGDAPSALRLILPESNLESPDCPTYIDEIHAAMQKYMEDGTLVQLPAGVVLLARETGGAAPRRGLVLAFDLDTYEYAAGSASPIRPTEKTVVERIPPRLKVREGASVELPHIMLLIDDPERQIIEPLYERRAEFSKLYDVELMQDGGHLTGWYIPEGDETEKLLDKLAQLSDPAVFNKKYGITDNRVVLPYAVGDGNHSMATAKAYWEGIKATIPPEEWENHPARFVLAEVVNIHDESIVIEGIYRALFHVDAVDVLDAAKNFFGAHGAEVTITESVPAALPEGVQVFPFMAGTRTGYMVLRHSKWALPVAALQAFLDDYLAAHPAVKIDYIHGLDVLHELAAQPDSMGFELPNPAKEDLFRGVIFDGVLPRKTFSMGDAREKRFYMEARKIVK